MMTNDTAAHSGLSRFAPGLAMLRGYRREWLRDDIAAGLSVAAVALPGRDCLRGACRLSAGGRPLRVDTAARSSTPYSAHHGN